LKKSQPCLVLLLVLLTTLVAGCGDSDRHSVKGNVTVDSAPVENGYVYFSPLPGTKGPTAGAKITDGTYIVDASKGLFEGNYRVEIKVWRESDKVSEDFATGETTRGLVQVLPPKFNSQSDLTMELSPSKEESYDFHLKP